MRHGSVLSYHNTDTKNTRLGSAPYLRKRANREDMMRTEITGFDRDRQLSVQKTKPSTVALGLVCVRRRASNSLGY